MQHCLLNYGINSKLKVTTHWVICSFLQRRPEPRSEPSGSPEEDRQRGPAAQSPSDPGAGGGVKSTYNTTLAVDFMASHSSACLISTTH